MKVPGKICPRCGWRRLDIGPRCDCNTIERTVTFILSAPNNAIEHSAILPGVEDSRTVLAMVPWR